jgi:tetratricopeptide (TPR) repeat protein
MILNGLVSEDGLDWAYNSLGNLNADQSKLAEAEQMYERAL